ncbi:MAG TPA: aminopeptidase P family protein, partial [Chloroflexi bacterium]|nr:aminopeptidase P family protein [Chloroflexota bacterium]
MRARFDRVRAALDEAPFDALVLIPGPSGRYVSGVALHHSERLNLLVIPRAGRPAALAPTLEAPALEGLDVALYTWRDEEGPDRALRALLRDLRLEDSRLGVESGEMRFGEAERLRSVAPRAHLVPADALLAALRVIKDDAEIAAMRQAIVITERALAATIASLRAGQTEAEVAAELQVQLLRAGSQANAFSPLVVSGARSANPHFGPSSKRLEPGDVVILDCGAVWDGYAGDITRCVALEPVPDEIVAIYDLCRAANAAG